MKKALPLTLVLVGAALLITAVVLWIDSSTSTEPQSFGKTLLDWVTLIAGLGASIKGWMDLFKKEKPTPPTTKIDVKGGSPQILTGEHARNIQTDTYIENQTIHQPPEPKTPKSLDQLPAPPLDFIGREKELAQLHQNIQNGVVISGVQGMGGIGKTALGLKLAEQISPNYPDGQIYLDLRGTHEQIPLTPEQVMAHVIHSFHPEAALPIDFGELGAMYRSVLGGKGVLLFYDNARDEKQLKDLLPPKGCVLFVTSRQYFTLPGLVAIDLETLSPIDAIDLVQEIVSTISNKDAETLAQQCGYLPLAIRAAVSALKLRPDWSPTELIKRLSDNRARLGLVESSLSLSYDALDSELQKYLRQLGVFASPFDKKAILMLWTIDTNVDADVTIGKLLKTSLLSFDKVAGKYYFHDLTSLFLEKKFLEAHDSNKTLVHYAKSYVAGITELLENLTDMEFRLKYIGRELTQNDIRLKPLEYIKRKPDIFPSTRIRFFSVHTHSERLNLEPNGKILDISQLEEFSETLREVKDLLRVSIVRFKGLYRGDIVKVAEKFYARNSTPLPLVWVLARSTHRDLGADFGKLHIALRQYKFTRQSYIDNALELIAHIKWIILEYVAQVS